ncbi:MAG: hypothetical protein KDA64_08880, partial [Rhodospirillaceae bacterium]|nr:hypothetical protein [Rhodospirillaceae bacterium]
CQQIAAGPQPPKCRLRCENLGKSQIGTRNPQRPSGTPRLSQRAEPPLRFATAIFSAPFARRLPAAGPRLAPATDRQQRSAEERIWRDF